MVWEEGEYIYLSLHCHHQNDSCIKMGSDESHFNVSLIVRDKVTRPCPQTTTFEEKGEPKQHRTEVLPLTNTSLPPYRWAKPAIFLLLLLLLLPFLFEVFSHNYVILDWPYNYRADNTYQQVAPTEIYVKNKQQTKTYYSAVNKQP